MSKIPVHAIGDDENVRYTSISNIRAMPPASYPSSLVLSNDKGPLVTVNMQTGEHTFGEHYTPDEAARVFWNAVTAMRGKRP